MIKKFIAIDENGQFVINGHYLDHSSQALTMLKNLQRDTRGRYFTHVENTPIWVEAFDKPLIAKTIERKSKDNWIAHFSYNFSSSFSLCDLSLDEWNRIHGLTIQNVSFVLSPLAQKQFYQHGQHSNPHHIKIDDQIISLSRWFIEQPELLAKDFWNKKYLENDTPWDLKKPAPALEQAIAQLKIPKQRILVLGCGTGADAAFLAKLGHIVTAVDISSQALEIAKNKYEKIRHLQFLQSDIFSLPKSFHQSFDLIFEHTCYCAIPPHRRNELVQVWKKALTPDGHLLGIFFTMDQRTGPPFGGSEWEIRERLKNSFDFLYWTRWKHSEEGRQGAELVVFARRQVTMN